MSWGERVRRLGGKLTTCHPKPIVIGKRREHTQGCGHTTRAVIPTKGGYLAVCRNCDMADQFPRFNA